jgi:SAM-dependent methyltransferase
MSFVTIRKRFINTISYIDNEERQLVKFLAGLGLSSGRKVVEVGCGFGRKLKYLRDAGFEVVGVEVNPDIVKANRDAGLSCLTVEEFASTDDRCDVLLMLHVIEHFMPAELLTFMDSYLDRLKPGGYLIIATPLASPSFHDDFDHVKPYHPAGISMVFGREGGQVQYYARNRLELIDLWYRRGVRVLKHFPGLLLPEHSRLPVVINVLSALLFRVTFGLFGRKDGWVGLYRKIAPAAGE